MRMRLGLALMMAAVLPLSCAADRAAIAEGGLTGALSTVTPTQARTYAPTLAPTLAPTITPSPSPEPTPAPPVFEGDGLKFALPQGFELVEGDARAGFEAALQADYPDAAQTLFAAMDPAHEAAIVVSFVETTADSLDAAREAADALLGDPEAVAEVQFGENRFVSFACAIGERGYHLYYFSVGARLYVIGASGLENAQIEEMLSGAEISPQETAPDTTTAP